MLQSIHFLLTYSCNFECEHCFLYSRPGAGGTFHLDQVCSVLDQALEVGTITGVCFEGGEPMLYYPLLLESIRQARQRGLTAGVVTNAYWATSQADAELWLAPLHEAGVDRITMSDDALHYGDASGVHKQRVEAAAAKVGMSAGVICTERPVLQPAKTPDGQPTIAGSVMFRGRAADRLTSGLPRSSCASFRCCSREKLDAPSRVHVDCYGNVHLCQGLCMGNLWKMPLAQLVATYRPHEHPIVGPLLDGGPANLARTYNVATDKAFVDECHCCYAVRRELIPRFPDLLAPSQVYGIDPNRPKTA